MAACRLTGKLCHLSDAVVIDRPGMSVRPMLGESLKTDAKMKVRLVDGDFAATALGGLNEHWEFEPG
ncbi:hypothetical protein CKO36_04605 [Rhabdochromatium marinum]|nr:hypothetical protein [Rhabdochromatium marinum]